jgi:hypothetical protein
MLDQRLDDAANGVKVALNESVPPPLEDLVRSGRPVIPPVANGSFSWRGPLVAVGTALAILMVAAVSMLLLRSDQADVVEEPTPTTPVSPTTTVATAETTLPPAEAAAPAIDAWNPILTTAHAETPPQAATCPGGANPDRPGRTDQARPATGGGSNQAAVFDRRSGRIVYVDEPGRTWTFDVCTNTWRQMDPTGAPWGDPETFFVRTVGELVYDIDSDRTIAIGPRFVSVYDANTNTWTQQSAVPNPDLAFGSPGLGAVYDPVSGLVLLVTSDGVLMAYDVDSDGWTEVGMIIELREITSEGQTQDLYPPFLVGYVAEADRLAFLGFNAAPFQDSGALINPRGGATTNLEGPDGGVRGGFGSFSYATGGNTAFVLGDAVSGLDGAALSWERINRVGRTSVAQIPAAMVVDSINSRLVLINDGGGNWPGTLTDDSVTALDLNTGEWIELLARSDDQA